jgi:hypothetical protein
MSYNLTTWGFRLYFLSEGSTLRISIAFANPSSGLKSGDKVDEVPAWQSACVPLLCATNTHGGVKLKLYPDSTPCYMKVSSPYVNRKELLYPLFFFRLRLLWKSRYRNIYRIEMVQSTTKVHISTKLWCRLKIYERQACFFYLFVPYLLWTLRIQLTY